MAVLTACTPQPQTTTLEFWAMGQEGERVKALLPAFASRHPDIRVKVQQIPWSAAHEKLLTAFVGDSLPDVFQLGTTWIAEFVALKALEPLDTWLSRERTANLDDFFPGSLASTRIDGHIWSLPWYVDTRLLFYRKDLLARVGITEVPRDWSAWLAALRQIRAADANAPWGLLLPMNEWQVPTILALQQGASLLSDAYRHGAFRAPAFRRAFTFYLDLFRQGLAPVVADAQIANLYQEFAAGRFACYISGPWNLGELRRRLPPQLQEVWDTAPLPSPDGVYPGLSLAGGANLALSKTSKHREDAWKLIAYLSETEQQIAFYQLSGDLPARRSAWNDPALSNDPKLRAFRQQLERTVSLPAIPEWERIAAKLAQYAERAVRGELNTEQALTAVDAQVEHILEKRRWLLDRGFIAQPSQP